jgi:hypothetical protein
MGSVVDIKSGTAVLRGLAAQIRAEIESFETDARALGAEVVAHEQWDAPDDFTTTFRTGKDGGYDAARAGLLGGEGSSYGGAIQQTVDSGLYLIDFFDEAMRSYQATDEDGAAKIKGAARAL